MKAQLEYLRNEISQIVKKIRVSQKLQNCKIQLNWRTWKACSENLPNVEWWDSVLLARRYPNKDEPIIIKSSTIWNFAEHPTQIWSPGTHYLFFRERLFHIFG